MKIETFKFVSQELMINIGRLQALETILNFEGETKKAQLVQIIIDSQTKIANKIIGTRLENPQ